MKHKSILIQRQQNNPMTTEPTVKLSLLMHYELPYEDVQHLMALPIESRKAALFSIIMRSTPTNEGLQDFEMHHFRYAVGKAFGTY